MPVFVMSCFKLFKSFCTEINRLLVRFWWGTRDGEFKVHWKKWKEMATNKDQGGMGFRNIQLFNEALLAKQLWRILSHPNLLVSKVLKAKYFANASPFDATPKGSSWFWNSVTSVKYLLEVGLRKRVSDGRTIHIWKDRWIPGNTDGRVNSNPPEDCQLMMVEQLIHGVSWNSELLTANFNQLNIL
ncbi:hypothetical protein ACH5RR_020844 [Cinchona calisaya]|uniref:Uncharacterized protein n=1 Tax=Cinchona calisaya TaxID=153742 RepID=A0ABD2ZFL7_9GENT